MGTLSQTMKVYTVCYYKGRMLACPWLNNNRQRHKNLHLGWSLETSVDPMVARCHNRCLPYAVSSWRLHRNRCRICKKEKKKPSRHDSNLVQLTKKCKIQHVVAKSTKKRQFCDQKIAKFKMWSLKAPKNANLATKKLQNPKCGR